MEDMFRGGQNFNQPIGSLDVSNVTKMRDMFRGCQNFNQPIGSWDVSNVTKMRDMLESAYAMEDKHKSGKVIKAH